MGYRIFSVALGVHFLNVLSGAGFMFTTENPQSFTQRNTDEVSITKRVRLLLESAQGGKVELTSLQ